MNIDETIKLILVLAVSFSIVGISIQVMRLIGGLADSIQDLRRAFKNVSNLSDLLISDYEKVSDAVESLLGSLANIRHSFLDPISKALAVFGVVNNVVNRKKKAKGTVEEDIS